MELLLHTGYEESTSEQKKAAIQAFIWEAMACIQCMYRKVKLKLSVRCYIEVSVQCTEVTNIQWNMVGTMVVFKILHDIQLPWAPHKDECLIYVTINKCPPTQCTYVLDYT